MIYFTYFPVLLVIANLVIQSHFQHIFMEIGRLVVEGGSIYFVAWISTAKKGKYRDISNFKLDLTRGMEAI